MRGEKSNFRGVAGRVAAAGAAAALLMSGCGGGETAPLDSPSSEPAARTLLISATDLPGKWRDSSEPGPGFRQLVCGVDIEPTPAVDGVAVRFSQSALGPFMEQHVRVHPGTETPAKVVNDLKSALPGCSKYTTGGNREDSPQVTFTVRPLKVPGLPAEAAAWQQTATSGSKITTDMALVARGDKLVAFVSYALRDDPDPAALAAAVKALGETSAS